MSDDRDFWHVDWDEEVSANLTENQLAALDKLAREVADRQMAVPALMFLESIRPLNYIASQLMLFFEPVTAWMLGVRELVDLRRAFEKRESIDVLIEKIEHYDNLRLERFKAWRAEHPSFFARIRAKIFRKSAQSDTENKTQE